MSTASRRFTAFACFAALGAAMAGTPALASRLIQPQVSGQVTSVNGTTAVTVDGTTYLIDRNSPAFQVIQRLHPGDRIGLVLNGPAGSATTQVINIVTGAAAKPAAR